MKRRDFVLSATAFAAQPVSAAHAYLPLAPAAGAVAGAAARFGLRLLLGQTIRRGGASLAARAAISRSVTRSAAGRVLSRTTVTRAELRARIPLVMPGLVAVTPSVADAMEAAGARDIWLLNHEVGRVSLSVAPERIPSAASQRVMSYIGYQIRWGENQQVVHQRLALVYADPTDRIQFSLEVPSVTWPGHIQVETVAFRDPYGRIPDERFAVASARNVIVAHEADVELN